MTTERLPPTSESFVALLGGFPAKPPLEARILDTEHCGTHTRRLVEYTTIREERVQAFVLVPHVADATERTRAGILAIHQDGGTRPYHHGKSEPAGMGGDPDLRYGLELCLRGYVVICPDRFPYESRSLANSVFADQFASFRICRCDDERPGVELTEDLYRSCVATKLLFDGWSPLGKELFELMRCLDCLVSQPETNGERLGVIGHSAGGLLAAFLMYLDPRLRAGCASCGTWLFESAIRADYLRPMQGFTAYSFPPGMAKWGDVDDVLAGLAPRPFLETSGDHSPGDVPKDLTEKARTRYQELGVPERYQYLSYGGGHTFRQDMRERSYTWFDRWLT